MVSTTSPIRNSLLGLVALAAVLFISAFSVASAQNGTATARPEGVIPGRYIVVFNNDVADPRGLAQALGQQHGFGVGHSYASALKGFSAALSPGTLQVLGRDPSVDYIEADQYVHAIAQTTPRGVQRIFADTVTDIADGTTVLIDGVDDVRVDVDVAVIDSGIDLDHEDLNVMVDKGIDCTNESKGNPRNRTVTCAPGGDDDYFHGTHVAGIIGALDNGLGVVGVAPGARLWPVKVLQSNGSGSMAMVIAGVDYVTANAADIEIANMSLGCECSSGALDTAISTAVTSGVVFVVAAGNDSKDAENFSPANHPDVITVSALVDDDGLSGGLGAPTCMFDEDDTLASFSNFGATVDVVAPGVCILSTWNDGGYDVASGTSMASPHVAGAAALMMANGATVQAVRDVIAAMDNSGWTDDSGDATQEPLLDVSGFSTTVTTLPQPWDTGPDNAYPSVSIYNPSDGLLPFGSGALISFSGSASDDNPGTMTNINWISNIDGTLGSGDDVSAVLSDGVHRILALVADSEGARASDEVEITVGDPPPASVVFVGSIDHVADGRKKTRLVVTINIVDLDGPVAGVNATVSIIQVDNTGSTIAGPWVGTGTTGSTGSLGFKVIGAPVPGCYVTTVTNVTNADWDAAYGANNPTSACVQ